MRSASKSFRHLAGQPWTPSIRAESRIFMCTPAKTLIKTFRLHGQAGVAHELMKLFMPALEVARLSLRSDETDKPLYILDGRFRENAVAKIEDVWLRRKRIENRLHPVLHSIAAREQQ